MARRGARPPAAELMRSPSPASSGLARPARAPLVGECVMGALAVAAALCANSAALDAHAARVALDALVCLVALFAPRGAASHAGNPGEPTDKGEALAILGVVASAVVVLGAAATRCLETWANPRPLEGTAAGLVALGVAGAAQFIFWTRFYRASVGGSPLARSQARAWGHAVTLTLFAFVAVVAGSIERGERPWLWRLDSVAGLLLVLASIRSLCLLGWRALLVLASVRVV